MALLQRFLQLTSSPLSLQELDTLKLQYKDVFKGKKKFADMAPAQRAKLLDAYNVQHEIHEQLLALEPVHIRRNMARAAEEREEKAREDAALREEQRQMRLRSETWEQEEQARKEREGLFAKRTAMIQTILKARADGRLALKDLGLGERPLTELSMEELDALMERFRLKSNNNG